MARVNILVCIAVAVIFVSFWALLNQPEMEPPWPSRIQGVSFSPMRAGNDPVRNNLPTATEVEADLKLLAGKTNAVRTYSVAGVHAKIPELARKYDLNVTLGAWIGPDHEENEQQLKRVIRLARENYRNVVRVIIGNEVILRGDLTVKELNRYLERARKGLDIPVSTAEPWHVWIQHPELANQVDFIATHMLPYWEGIHLDRAVDYVLARYTDLTRKFPDKLVVIGEVGWPSNGRTRKEAVASVSNQATFLRRFLAQAEALDYVYYVMEAFDQPWKQKNTEGAVGAYWGVYDVERQAKFPLTSAIVSIPEWQTLATVSVIIAAICFMLMVIDSRKLSIRGRGFLAAIAFLSATGTVWIVYSYSRQYLTLATVLVGILMITGLIGVVVVLLAEAHEWAEAIWGSMGRRPCSQEQVPGDLLPKVSIHVPAYNEPPGMMIETLNGLAGLDYPCFEVIVMDNNTKDPAVWQPVEAHCRALGSRFRFFHEDELAGFKSGALNYALARTAADASVIAVIDSDYVVEADWLHDLAPQFLKPEVAIVQAPQDYRDDRESLFKAMCYAEYRGFFNIGMVVRNERNAIIQHGTMTMVRRSVLEEVGAWSEWCITEDAELGLRIFKKGYEALYIAKSYGRGLMPDTFIDFKKQRFRWAYGSMQIMRHHLGALLSKKKSQLTYGQRYHFIAGWLPWIADSINLLFTATALVWSLAMISFPRSIDAPMMILSMVPLSFFVFKLAKMLYLYHQRVKASTVQTIASALTGLALTHTIAKAMLLGLFSRDLPFFRTPKRVGTGKYRYALQAAREEGLIAVALLLAAYGLFRQQGMASSDQLVWIIVLLVQSTPYLAAMAISSISACGQFRDQGQLVEPITGPRDESSDDATVPAA
ncbi:glycosyltransferase family 2 protein [Desulfogranum mediterraneum]|uniref:glycosyltransferase family 2 protein n=1 Tax=Desulfogranum mediterraneum TaxID=160661 RepID=UPI00041D13EF|nr:glycosyltransferase [Desulfogranum mediterraneum]